MTVSTLRNLSSILAEIASLTSDVKKGCGQESANRRMNDLLLQVPDSIGETDKKVIASAIDSASKEWIKAWRFQPAQPTQTNKMSLLEKGGLVLVVVALLKHVIEASCMNCTSGLFSKTCTPSNGICSFTMIAIKYLIPDGSFTENLLKATSTFTIGYSVYAAISSVFKRSVHFTTSTMKNSFDAAISTVRRPINKIFVRQGATG